MFIPIPFACTKDETDKGKTTPSQQLRLMVWCLWETNTVDVVIGNGIYENSRN